MSTNQVLEFFSFDCPHVNIRNILDENVAGLYGNKACPVTNGVT